MKYRTIKVREEWIPALVVVIRAGILTVTASEIKEVDQGLVDWLNSWCDRARERFIDEKRD